MTTTEVSPSWLPDCALGPLCPFFDVKAVSGSIVGEAVVPGADWAESLPGLDCCEDVVVEREYRNALRGYALRVPDGSLDTIRAVSGVQAVYLDGNNRLH